MRNKAQLGDLRAIVLTLVIIGMVLGIGLFVMDELRDKTNTVTSTQVNETTSAVVKEDGVYFAYNGSTGGRNCWAGTPSSVACINRTSGTVIPTANYTVSSSGKISYSGATSTSGLNNSYWNCTYSATYGDEACEAVSDVINATGTIPEWLPIVVILLIVGILLVIVFKVLPSGGGGMSFGGFGRGSGGTVAEI